MLQVYYWFAWTKSHNNLTPSSPDQSAQLHTTDIIQLNVMMVRESPLAGKPGGLNIRYSGIGWFEEIEELG